MYLSGSTKEFRSILLAASDLKASAIHFISPNIIFILAGNKKDYVFASTTIIIGQSLLVPKASYKNMHLYIKSTKKAYSNPLSPFYLETIGSVAFTPGQVSFNHSEHLTLKVDIPAYPMKKEIESKIKDSIQSSFDLESPFLSFPTKEADRIHSVLQKNKRRYFDKTQKSADNAIRIEKQHLVILSKHDDKRIKMRPDITEYSVSEQFEDIPYTFSDRSFYLFRWLAQTTPVEEFTFIPRDQYCIIEGYRNGLSIKVRTNIRNDLDIK